MTAPKRIQRRRTKGWRMPEGAVYVGRPTRWGNPFEAWATRDGMFFADEYDRSLNRMSCATASSLSDARRIAADSYRDALANGCRYWELPTADQVRLALAGRDLACWCRLDQPCHADVLLAIANGRAR